MYIIIAEVMCEGGSDSSPSLIGNPLTTCTTVVDSDALIVRCPCGYNEVYILYAF